MNSDEDKTGFIEKFSKGKERVNLTNFLLLSVIGKGSYAKVVLVRKKNTNEIYALKILKKGNIEMRNQKTHVKTERNILIEVDHPFIIKMAHAFQNERKLFFALEYCPGGELFNLLQKKRTFSEDHARFYAVQIVLALEHLHSKDIVYRDLKPENVLIDKDGFVRLTDFGLSKRNITGNRGAHSVCGTPEYLAPEILFRMGHGKAVDWWTVGAILYEMLTGLPPFYTPNREELFERIKFGTLKYPSHLSPNARNLLEGLFKKDPEKRLGGGPDDAKTIKAHPWFAGIDWEAFLLKEVKAPFKPIIKGESDVSNFDPEFTETPLDSYKDPTQMDSLHEDYGNWTFSAESILKKNEAVAEKMELE